MVTRDVNVAVSGLVVGLILGAGVLSLPQSGSLSASATSAHPYGRRAIDQKYEKKELPLYNTPKEAAPVEEAAPDVPPTSCEIAKAIVSTIAKAHARLIPDRPSMNQMRQELTTALISLETEYCPPEAVAKEDVVAPVVRDRAAEQAVRVRYCKAAHPTAIPGSITWTKCLIEQGLTIEDK